MSVIATIFLFLALFIPALTVTAGEPVQKDGIVITVKAQNTVKGEQYSLGEIADIKASPFIRQAIEAIEVGRSPQPEKILCLDKNRIIFLINRQKFLPDSTTVKCPEHVYVKRLGQTISEDDVEKYIKSLLKVLYIENEFELVSFNIRGLEPYPAGRVEFRTDDANPVDKNGNLRGHLEVIVDGNSIDRLSISGRVRVYKKIVFASQDLSRGCLLTRGDVYEKKWDVYSVNSGFLPDLEEAIGKQLTRSIKKDDILTGSILSQPPLVKKGEVITLVAQTGNLRIITTGISKEDGLKNDWVKVENIRSGKLVRGMVTKRSTVEVIY